MVNIAILNAVKNSNQTSNYFSYLLVDRKTANAEDFEYSMDRITMGIGRKKMFVSDKDKLVTAYHEGKKFAIMIFPIISHDRRTCFDCFIN